MRRVGIAVHPMWVTECTECGVENVSATRALADESAIDHADQHSARGDLPRRFRSFSAAERWSTQATP